MSLSARQMDEIKTSAAQWILKRDRGDLSAQDRAMFEAWLSADARHREAYLSLDEAWRASAGLKTWRPADGRIDTRILNGGDSVAVVNKRGSPRLRFALVTAAVLAVAVGAGHWLSSSAGDRYITAVGGLQVVPLPDGSRLTLNTNTQLRVAIGGSAREIHLTRGEAYFEVARDASRPFIVYVGNQRVVAVGTQFSVRRDADDVRVSVTEGAVRLGTEVVSGPDPSAGADLLTAGSIAVLARSGVTIQHRALPDLQQQLTWRTGILVFRDQPLAEVVDEFNRYNQVQIHIDSPQLAALKVGGNFHPADLPAVLDAFRTLGMQVTRRDGSVHLAQTPP